MPLPLPNLDTRRWADLVEEGRTLIPRYALGWTDHNVHDPGITLIELFAWLVEQEIYRANRIPERHRRKFLALLGYLPQPPRAARTVVGVALTGAAAPAVLPAGAALEALAAPGLAVPFRTLQELHAVAAELVALEVADGSGDEPARYRLPGGPIALFGADAEFRPDALISFTLIFSRPLPLDVLISLWLRLEGPGNDAEERVRLLRELDEQAEACRPAQPTAGCAPETTRDPWCAEPNAAATKASAAPESRLRHHDARTVWEFFADDGGTGRWQQLNPAGGALLDETRDLTLDGRVLIRLPGPMAPVTDAGGASAFLLRCRLEYGRYDAPSVLVDLLLNGVPVEQTAAVWTELPIAAGVTPGGPAASRGALTRLRFVLDPSQTIQSVDFSPDHTDIPEVRVLDYRAPTAIAPGVLALQLALLGISSGLPLQRYTLVQAPVHDGALQLWTVEGEQWREWTQRSDFDSSRGTDLHFTLSAGAGTLAFGAGDRGRIPPAGSPIVAMYRGTLGEAGNLRIGVRWQLADNLANRARWDTDDPAHVDELRELLARPGALSNRIPATGGASAEALEQATGRAATALWAHESLVQLCDRYGCVTLDQLDRELVLAHQPPERATTLLDFERLALATPGTRIARAWACAGLDSAMPGLPIAGTVTLVVVPYLPHGRPQPSAGLLRAVRRYVGRRRVIGTRLLVVGPQYLEVRVRATVRAYPRDVPEQVRARVVAALDSLFDPLRGGPTGRGWPFGRDVYRAEVMQAIDAVPGVDHVLALELLGGEDQSGCGNLCVPPTWLVAPGRHEISIVWEPGRALPLCPEERVYER